MTNGHRGVFHSANEHSGLVYPLHRYLLYVPTLSADFYPLPSSIEVTDGNRFKPIRSNAGNGVTDEIPGYTQIMRKLNQKRIDRTATKASILRFVDTAVLPERGSRDNRLAMMLSKIEGLKKKHVTLPRAIIAPNQGVHET